MKFDFNFLKNRIINLITKPQNEWQTIKSEEASVNSLYLKYAIFLAAIPAIAGFIGHGIIGGSYGPLSFRMPIARTLVWTIFQYCFALGGAFAVGLIIDTLAPSFNAKKNLVDSLKISIYASSVSWAFGILFILPRLYPLVALVSLYGLYVMFLGLKEIKSPPKDKEIAYFVVTIISAIVIFFIIGFLSNTIAFGGMYR